MKTKAPMKCIVRLTEKEAFDAAIVGQKFSSLAKARKAGFAVPDAAAIITKVHGYYMAHQSWPEGVLEEILNAAIELGLENGLSVRSSAVREDLENRSFAGQYNTYLNVNSKNSLKNHVEKCWQSIDSETVQSYVRDGNQCESEHLHLMGVIVQRMVPAIYAGVAFSRNPMNPSRDEIVIEGNRGLAENLVSGHASPYRAIIDGNEKITVDPPPGEEGLHHPNATMLLDKAQWLAIADLVHKLEISMNYMPQDIEWAIDTQDKLWLLQSRNITTFRDYQLSIPSGTWTRNIAVDLWADRLTPFLAHAMIKNASKYDLTHILNFMGIPVTGPVLTTINGYLYVSNGSIEELLAYIPRRFWIPEFHALFPPGYHLDKIPLIGLFKRMLVILRSTILPFKEPGINPLLCVWLASRNQKKANKQLENVDHLPHATPEQTFQKTSLSLDALAYIQAKNQWPYTFATVFMWLLRWLVVDRLGLHHWDFLKMLTGRGRNITIEIEREFRKIAQIVLADEIMVERFLTESADQLSREIPEKLKPHMHHLLNQYGCRSRHRSLYVKRWAEAPEEVMGIIQSLVHQKKATSSHVGKPKIQGNAVLQDASKQISESVLNLKKPFSFSRLSLGVTLKLTLAFLDLREELRFLLDKSLYQIRRCLIILGQQTNMGDQIMFLTQEEIENLIHGKLAVIDAQLLAQKRHHSFAEPFKPSTFYVDGQPVDEFHMDTEVMRGTGASLGRATGRARIVEKPTQTNIKKGDIIIARHTDPGWTPILSIVGGMVVEEGGLLNHCSIVARELAIPSIVGVQQATQKIPEGSLITIDGGLGLIRLEDRRKAGV